MFGGIAWMVNGNMACGIVGEDLMVRLERDDAEAALSRGHIGPMEFTGRPMRGFIMVEAVGRRSDADLGDGSTRAPTSPSRCRRSRFSKRLTERYCVVFRPLRGRRDTRSR